MKKWPLRIINYLMGVLILSSIHCTVTALVLAKDRGTFVSSLIYIPVIIILSEAQKRTKYFWQYIIWAAISLGYIHLFSRSDFERKLGITLTFVAVILYFYARAKKADCILDTPGYPFLGIYIVMYFLERQYPSRLLETYAVIGAGVCFLLCMYKTNFDEMEQVFDVNEKLERFPEQRLLKNNLFMMMIQTLIVIAGMIAALFTGIDGVIDKIGEVLKRLILWILKLMESVVEGGETEFIDGEKELLYIEVGEQSLLMQIILKILDYVSTALVIALVVYFVFKVLKKLYQLYLEFDMNSSENGDEIEKIYNVQTKEEKRQLKKKKEERLFWDRSPNARIRKYYKRRVLKELKEAPRASLTPEEIAKDVEMTNEQKQIFSAYYEKARYGNESCTKDEMQEYLKI